MTEDEILQACKRAAGSAVTLPVGTTKTSQIFKGGPTGQYSHEEDGVFYYIFNKEEVLNSINLRKEIFDGMIRTGESEEVTDI